MRLWTQRCRTVWFLAALAGPLAGCGGSSSETPEPARPESWQLKLRHQRQIASADLAQPTNARDDESYDVAPVRSTWGSDRATSGSTRDFEGDGLEADLPTSAPAPIPSAQLKASSTTELPATPRPGAATKASKAPTVTRQGAATKAAPSRAK